MDRTNYTEKADQKHENKRFVMRIDRVEQQDLYVLHFYFANGQQRIIDFEPYLKTRKAYLKYLDPDLFSKYKTRASLIYWPGNIIDFPSWMLLGDNPPGTIIPLESKS